MARIKYCKTKQKIIVYSEEGFHGLNYIKLKIECYKNFATYYNDKDLFYDYLEYLINDKNIVDKSCLNSNFFYLSNFQLWSLW